MSQLWDLFEMFIRLSLMSFGGGYVILSMMPSFLMQNNLATMAQFQELFSIASMAPGPVAVNSAVGLGYMVHSVRGAMVAFLGIALPCSFLVILVAKYFFRLYEKPWVKAILYGIGPVTAGLVFFAAIGWLFQNGIVGADAIHAAQDDSIRSMARTMPVNIKSVAIFGITLVMLIKTKIHPALFIVGFGVIGVFIF